MGMDAIDFHLHLPWWHEDPGVAAAALLGEMDSAGVRLGVVIAVDVSVKPLLSRVTPRGVYKALNEVLDYIAYQPSGMLSKIASDPEAALEEHVALLQEHYRDSMDVILASRASGRRLVPVVGYNPEKGVDWLISLLREHWDEILGVKIFPTLNFTDPSHRGLHRLYRTLENHGKIVIVHTGCDPGIWELPAYCKLARPRLVAEAARRFRDLVFIVAHLGSYSMLMPGIFFSEALEAMELDNVYADTSAVDPYFVELAVERVGSDRLLYGSDYPYLVGARIRDSIQWIMELGISRADKRRILYENARRMLSSRGFQV